MFNFKCFKNKCILISGATGMISSQIINLLLDQSEKYNLNIHIIALYRNETKKNKIFARYCDNQEIEWICGDVREPIYINGNVDYIIHSAGVTGGSKQHVEKPLDTIFTALKGTTNLLDLARIKQVKSFVFLSSLEIYGLTDFDLPTITEKDGGYLDPLSVRSSYSESKRMCENLCVAYLKQYGVPTKIVRLTATYGKGASYSDNRVLCEFAKCIIEKRNIVLHSYGETVRNYCDVSDAVMAILFVLLYGIPGQAYNVANMNTEISIRELAEKFISLFPEAEISICYDLPENIEKLGYNETRKIRLNSEKLQELGWEPKADIDEMIYNLVSALRDDREKI